MGSAWPSGRRLTVGYIGGFADEKPFGMDSHAEVDYLAPGGLPDPLPKYRLIRAFDKFVFKEPVCIAQDPTSDRFMVAEYTPGKFLSTE